MVVVGVEVLYVVWSGVPSPAPCLGTKVSRLFYKRDSDPRGSRGPPNPLNCHRAKTKVSELFYKRDSDPFKMRARIKLLNLPMKPTAVNT